MKSNKRKYSFGEKVTITLAISAMIIVYFSLFKGADMTSLETNDVFIFAFGVSIAAVGLGISFNSRVTAAQYQTEALHQSIGGYIPSDKLNDLVWRHFLRQGGIVSGIEKEDFVSKWEDTKKLLDVIEHYSLEENVSKKIVYCEIKRNGDFYKAISASKEMALSIAFLKSCGVETDQEFN